MNNKAKYQVGTKATFFGQPVMILNSTYSEWGGWYYDINLCNEDRNNGAITYKPMRVEEEYLKTI